MRAEFSKHCQLWRYSEEVDENDFFINATTQRALDVWVTAWQASRQALVVELPSVIAGGFTVEFYTEREIKGALDKAGVSYK